MARAIVGGTAVPAEVVFVGEKVQIWKIDSVLTVFVGARNITVTEEDATEREQDLEQLSAEQMDDKLSLRPRGGGFLVLTTSLNFIILVGMGIV